jgi:hypothetical protein
MEDDPIIADELPVLEDVMARTRIPMETKARDNHTPLSGSQIYLTLPEVITSTTAHFKRRRVFTPIENDVLALIIEVHVVAFPLPRLPVLSVEVATTRTFTWDSSLKEQLNVVYSSLKEQIQSFVLQLSSNDKLLQAIYNQVDTLKREIFEPKTTQDGLRVELLTFREEA